MDTSPALVRASVVQLVRCYVAERDVDFGAVLDEVGLGREYLDDHIANLPLERVIALFERIAEVLSDSCFGLHLSANVPPGGSGLVGRLMMSSPTVRDGVKVMVRYAQLQMTKIDVDFREEEGLGYLRWSLPPELAQPRLQYSSFMSALVIRRIAQGAGAGWRPLKTEFAHRALDCESEARDVFGDRMKFDCPANLFVWENSALDVPSPTADAASFAVYEDLARRWSEELSDQRVPDVVVSTREQILANLAGGTVGLSRVAEGVGINARALQRRLDQAGTTFEKILNETRIGLSEQLLRDTDLSFTQIAFELGYSDSSAFTRAANRWFNMSPREYRQRCRAGRRSVN